MLIFLTGCSNQINTVEVEKNTNDLVSVEYFMEYYGLTQEDIGDFDLQAMIFDCHITEECLEKDGDFWLITMQHSIEDGTVFGYDAEDYISLEQRDAVKGDDFTNTRYIFIDNWLIGDDRDYIEQIMIDVEKKKLYYSENNDWRDFSQSEIICEVEDDKMSDILISLNDMDMYRWKNDFLSSSKKSVGDYYGDLYIVMDDKTVIRIKISGPGNNKKMDAWYNLLLEIVNKT